MALGKQVYLSEVPVPLDEIDAFEWEEGSCWQSAAHGYREKLHAVKTKDGRIWDAVNGWRVADDPIQWLPTEWLIGDTSEIRETLASAGRPLEIVWSGIESSWGTEAEASAQIAGFNSGIETAASYLERAGLKLAAREVRDFRR